jgi:anti-sigma factor RsiW
MGIVNRTLDASEQKEAKVVNVFSPVNGTEVIVGPIERAMTISDVKATLLGISGAPTVHLRGLRFIAGTGGSTFAIGSSFAVTAFGTSGYVSYSLPASGSTLLNLQKGDAIAVIFGGGTGAACTTAAVEIVAQNVQDIKTWY